VFAAYDRSEDIYGRVVVIALQQHGPCHDFLIFSRVRIQLGLVNSHATNSESIRDYVISQLLAQSASYLVNLRYCHLIFSMYVSFHKEVSKLTSPQ
jgi:hypothetical protein